MIEIGIDSFAATIPDPVTGRTLPAADRMEKRAPELRSGGLSVGYHVGRIEGMLIKHQ